MAVVMGKRNRTAVITYWAPLLSDRGDARALTLAYCIADTVPDGDAEFWGGQRIIAEWLGVWRGGQPFDDVARQAARRAVRRLVDIGFLEVVKEPSSHSPGTFRCHWKEPPIWPGRGP